MTKPPTGDRNRKSRGRSPRKILGFFVISTDFRMFLASFCIIWTFLSLLSGRSGSGARKILAVFQTKSSTFDVSEYSGAAAAEPGENFVIFEAKSRCVRRFMTCITVSDACLPRILGRKVSGLVVGRR